MLNWAETFLNADFSQYFIIIPFPQMWQKPDISKLYPYTLTLLLSLPCHSTNHVPCLETVTAPMDSIGPDTHNTPCELVQQNNATEWLFGPDCTWYLSEWHQAQFYFASVLRVVGERAPVLRATA